MKILIKRLIHSIGYHLHRLDERNSSEYQLYKSFKKFKIDLVLDIG